MKKQSAMAALAGAAMAIPAIAQANTAPTETTLGFRVNQYAEQEYQPLALGDDSPTSSAYDILNYQLHASGGVGKRFGYYIDYGFETLAGASVQAAYKNGEVNGDGDIKFTGQNHLILSGATKVRETRHEIATGARLYNAASTVGGEAYYSGENDYESVGGSVDASFDFKDQRITYSFGASGYIDQLTPTQAITDIDKRYEQLGQKPPSFQASRANAWQQSKQQVSAFNGLSAIINKNLLMRFGASVTWQSGYLSDPYRFIAIACGNQCIDDESTEYINESEITDGVVHYSADHRPDDKIAWTASSGLRQYIDNANAALHVDARYYGDTWGVHSLTLNSAWYQRFNFSTSAESGVFRWFERQETSLLLAPFLRLHSQNQSDFYRLMVDPEITEALLGEEGNLPSAVIEGNEIVGVSEFFSSDPRLSSYGALALGANAELSVAGVRFTSGAELYRASGNYWGLRASMQDTNGLPQYWRLTAGVEYRF